ncbi:hypothetical protein LCGC14_0912250 [marine sediment metagenome]|uniref:Uncharacterized protein n=1 Tax=marine sediment metagenome TaxID=412755 RepID=A0A0F9S012_9ZZZZ
MNNLKVTRRNTSKEKQKENKKYPYRKGGGKNERTKETKKMARD